MTITALRELFCAADREAGRADQSATMRACSKNGLNSRLM